MIASQIKYFHDINLRPDAHGSLLSKDFLLRQFAKQLKEKYGPINDIVKLTDEEFIKNLNASKLLGVGVTGHASPNTVAAFELPDKGHIRGPFELLYDRMTLTEYFGMFPKLLGNQEVIRIEWVNWKRACQDDTLRDLIHRHISYHLGRTFSHQGTLLIDDKKQHPKTEKLKGIHPLALIIPSLETIKDAWHYVENTELYHRGEAPYQDLTITLRLVCSNHLFIQDGEIAIPVKLSRPLHYYTNMDKE